MNLNVSALPECFRPLHTLLGLYPLHCDTNSLVVKANSNPCSKVAHHGSFDSIVMMFCVSVPVLSEHNMSIPAENLQSSGDVSRWINLTSNTVRSDQITKRQLHEIPWYQIPQLHVQPLTTCVDRNKEVSRVSAFHPEHLSRRTKCKLGSSRTAMIRSSCNLESTPSNCANKLAVVLS